jgi:tRNA A-37 threonylcarbamoyl transferase component Bud32
MIYFAKLHLNDQFHGDIKPENIYFKNKIASSGAKSLISLNEQDELFDFEDQTYQIRMLTPSFSSKEHSKDVRS